MNDFRRSVGVFLVLLWIIMALLPSVRPALAAHGVGGDVESGTGGGDQTSHTGQGFLASVVPSSFETEKYTFVSEIGSSLPKDDNWSSRDR